MGAISLGEFSWVSDKNSDSVLLPEFLKRTTNSDEVLYLKAALETTVNEKLTEKEKSLLKNYYQKGKTKTQISKELGVTPSAVVKQMKTVELKLAENISFALKSYQKFKTFQ